MFDKVKQVLKRRILQRFLACLTVTSHLVNLRNGLQVYGAQNRKSIIDDRMVKLVVECELA